VVGKIKVTVRGVAELRRELNTLSVAVGVRLLNNAARAGARVVAAAARKIVPVRTSRLKASLTGGDHLFFKEI
jgi:Bacteriophage HK97-gp10, putative tail-component